MAADLDLLVLAELNPDVLVAAGDVDVRFGQVEQLVENATITLGSSGAITAAAAAAQGLRVALCAVVGDDQVGTWTTDLLADQGVDVSCVVRRAGRPTGMSVVITRPDGDRAILTFGGTMTELSAADVPHERLRAARHVHASSFFLQEGLRADLPDLFSAARTAGATTTLDTGWAPNGEWAAVKPVLCQVDYLLPNAAECSELAAAIGWRHEGRQREEDRRGEDQREDHAEAARSAAEALHKYGPAVAVKLGAAGGLLVGPEGGVTRVHGRAVAPVDTTGAGDCFNAGFIAGLLDGSTPAEALRRAVSSGAIAVTGWGGTGRLASRDDALSAAASLRSERLPAK
jgi:sugar/nucleoside kinase (ribokinase family)